MNRVLLSKTSFVGNEYWFKNTPFSGIGFLLNQDGIVSSYEFLKGRIIGSYSSICVPGKNEHLQIDVTGKLADYEQFNFNGIPYNGVGYEFSDGICDREVFVQNGLVLYEAHWNASGNMVYFDAPNAYFGESYEWYANGSLKIAEFQQVINSVSRLALRKIVKFV